MLPAAFRVDRRASFSADDRSFPFTAARSASAHSATCLLMSDGNPRIPSCGRKNTCFSATGVLVCDTHDIEPGPVDRPR
jgi:hypothetical protein